MARQYDRLVSVITAPPCGNEGRGCTIVTDGRRGLLAGSRLLPLVKGIDRHNASLAAGEGIAESRLCRHSLRHGVDAAGAELDILGPPRNQPPAEEIEGTPALPIEAHD